MSPLPAQPAQLHRSGPAPDNPANQLPRTRPARVLAGGFAVLTALLLAGCGPAATAGRPSTDPPAVREGSTASIEDTVTEAEKLLTELDQDFQQDDADTN